MFMFKYGKIFIAEQFDTALLCLDFGPTDNYQHEAQISASKQHIAINWSLCLDQSQQMHLLC